MQDAEHLLNALKQSYKITTDWSEEHYLGLTIKWAYTFGYVDNSMSGYIIKVLHKFQHLIPRRKQHAPRKWTEPVYGSKRQCDII